VSPRKRDKLDRLDRVFNAAHDEEIEAIEQAAFRAGVLWRCRSIVRGRECGWNNDESEKKCGDCGKAKPKEKA
jgi:hypothetical protein